MSFVGIDPGRTGALVVVGADGETALEVFDWTDQDTPPREIGRLVCPGDVVAIEAQYVGPGAHASLTLASWTGRLLDRIPETCTVLRPLATTWRAKVFRGARLRRREAKRQAIAACLARSGLAPELANQPDVAEAWAMARYAWGWAATHPEAP